MKKIRIIIAIFLIILIGAAWVSQGFYVVKNNTKYNSYISEADKCMENKLYQKAIEAYELALSFREGTEIRDKWLKAYEAGYDDGVVTKKKYVSALETVCTLYPKEAIYWETLLQMYVNNGEFTTAYSCYNKALKYGGQSEKLSELGKQIMYSYTVSKKTYTKVYRSPVGYYTLYDGTNWGVMDAAANWIYECAYEYTSPMGAEASVVYKYGEENRLLNWKKEVEAITMETIDNSRAVSEKVVPICGTDSKWSYLDCSKGEYFATDLDEAATFSNGIAAVKKGDKWSLITLENTKVCETEFDEIKLYSNGEYIYQDIMIASVAGTYGIYSGNGELKSNIPGVEADVYMGDYIAYKDINGKWGYVNESGDIVIEPQYENAKSFSNGLAAVYDGSAWGFIDKNGSVVIECRFLDADYFTKYGACFVSSYEGLYYLLQLRFN